MDEETTIITLVLPKKVADKLKSAVGGMDQALKDALSIYLGIADGSVQVKRK